MTMERFILIAISVISIASIFYIPKDKMRLSLLAFIVLNTTSWVAVLYLVQQNALEYPVRGTSFTTQSSSRYPAF